MTLGQGRRHLPRRLRSLICPAARKDILEQFTLFADWSLPHAKRFIDALAATVPNLPRTPNITVSKPRDPRLRNLRTWPIEGFERIKVYYIVREHLSCILRILPAERG